ncbi:MAG TPA: hypothetical protein DEF47_02100 [Herpetosiphon sp.]|uniref:hypothetical protein n=1 Tax=Herpetosiphon sp. TaxID=71864 RepID=UPI00059EB4CE|nr:hypothetical protein [Herpetosiphon sp.]HBW48679.1 hypothetical protein [Herpetosiphon sp.]
MNFDQRLIRQMPLSELWNTTGVVSTINHGSRGRKAIIELLRRGLVWFMIANVGDKPSWIPLDMCYIWWKTEIRDRLIEPEDAAVWIRYDSFPGGYCYVAEEWENFDGIPIIVLTVWH